jgi:sec-independent protein translocase protein TatA
MGSIGMPELIVVLVIALIVFGPKKLPEIGRGVGSAIREFKKASRDFMSHLEVDEPEPPRVYPTAAAPTDSPAAAPTDSPVEHDEVTPVLPPAERVSNTHPTT